MWAAFGGFEPRREKRFSLLTRLVLATLVLPLLIVVALTFIAVIDGSLFDLEDVGEVLLVALIAMIVVEATCVTYWVLFELGFLRSPGGFEPDRYVQTGEVVPEGDDSP